VLSEFKTDQILARVLRGDMDEPILESKLFGSKIHNQPVISPKFKSFLAEIMPGECLQLIWKYLARSFFSNEIDLNSNGLHMG
jgi:hypothetical protein